MEKTETYYEVTARASHTNFVYNTRTQKFDKEECACEWQDYEFETKEEMLHNFFLDFKPSEFKNNLNAYFQLRQVTETWTREDIEDEWEFEKSSYTVLIEFNEYDWLKNNGMI